MSGPPPPRKSTQRVYASIKIRIILVALISEGGRAGARFTPVLLRLPIYVAFITRASKSREICIPTGAYKERVGSGIRGQFSR